MKWRQVIMGLVVASGLWGSISLAQGTVSLDELRQVQGKIQSAPYLTLDFDQVIFRNLRKKSSRSQGQAYFANPGKFRWALTQPNANEWIFDGQSLINYRPSERSASVYDAQAGTGREIRQITSLVMNFDALLAEYSLKDAIREGSTIKVSLLPKRANDIVLAELSLDTAMNYVSSVRLTYRDKNVTTLTFQNPRTIALSPDLFAAPRGVTLTKIK